MIDLKQTVKSQGSPDGLSTATEPTGVKGDTLKLLQEQVKHEFFAERIYISMASWLDTEGYPETAKFFSHHAGEEKEHAMDFVNFILKRGERVNIPGTEIPPNDFDNAGALIQAAVDHEKFITQKIADIYASALEEGDIMALEIARQYSAEQIEEEQLFLSLLKLYELEDKISIDMEAQMHAYINKTKHMLGEI